jgi:phosphoribosyl-ATP pyrophosphohydrolase/phosphoribosyl-AMP cyclohydrolase/histidinol dehydrogenase
MTSTSTPLLRTLAPAEVPSLRRNPIDRQTLIAAGEIVDQVESGGEPALRSIAERLGDRLPAEPLVIERAQLDAALEATPAEDRAALERAADSIRRFASAQRESVTDFSIEAETPGALGQQVIPVERAGCYAPGGRFPLPSSVLMTAIPAKVAGVESITVASPRPAPITLAAAAVAGADRLLAVGGAQAIAAMAFGVGVDPVDVIVGPGNRWVTAAKQLVSGAVRIDMLAGPSELVVIADDSADPAVIAADLLAQAEHDTDAAAILISSSEDLIDRVNRQLAEQLGSLPTPETARAALANGFAVATGSNAQSAEIADRLAPEHLQIITRDAGVLARSIRHAGALFIGEHTAEVFGDYGLGPNHTLPTGGTARSFAGLSVFDFLRIRTTIHLSQAPDPQVVHSIARLARLEGLEAHARAAEIRLR